MFSFVGKIIGGNGAKFLADFFAVIFGSIGHTLKNTLLNIWYFIANLIASWVWMICKWALGFLDMFQFAFTRLLGLNLNEETTLSLGDYVEGMKDITISGGSNYYDYIMDIFRAVFGVSLVLMIVFTIVAMVIQEYNLAVNGYQSADNNKGKFFKVILSNILSILLIPLIFYTIIIGTNSILTSFYRALGGYSDTTIAGNVLAASTYDANRYRAYANANKRIPITISVYEMDNSFGRAKGDEELKKDIQNDETQKKLKAIAGAFAEDSFLPFEKSTIYDNGSWANYKNYSLEYNNTMYDDMGQYFENFICTREQYYVLADFIDYCQLYNVKYYIKSISEDDICWKYVDDLQVDVEIDAEGNAIGDLTLDVVYRDAEVVNNPSEVENYASASSGNSDSGFRTLQLTTKLDMTSPIADALKTASTLLGIDEKDSSFNVMERDDSGDFVNLVEWANRKVKLKLSSSFDLTVPSTWTFADQIIVYEYFRFENDFGATNNTLEDYTIAQLKNEGAYLDALEMTFRNYNSNTETYSDERKQYCVKLNGNYYRIKESDSDFDDYGDAYFVLTAVDENINYFENQRVTIEKKGSKEIKLSSDFDINKKSEWDFVEQLLVYEYFKDLSLSNGLRRTYKFTDFNYGSSTDTSFNYYTIRKMDDLTNTEISEKYYLYINGTYYECDGDGDLKTGGVNFLIETDKAGERWFGYKLSDLTKEHFGIDILGSYTNFVKENVDPEDAVDDKNAMYQKYSAMKMKLSEGFSFYNTDTWTFRDYVIMYIFVNTLSVDKNITIETLKLEGIVGEIVVSGNTYYLKVSFKDHALGADYIRYINLDMFSKTSEQKITESISSTQFDDLNLGATSLDFVHYFNKEEDVLLDKAVSSKFFEMSENFDAYDPQTWSIGDYLMIYLVEMGYMDTSIPVLKIKGYSSLCYETAGSGNFYRFGTTSNALYLSEKSINAIGYTVEKWFKTNLMSFVLSARYGNLGVSDLFIEEDKFADGIVTNADSFLYNLTDDFSNEYNLQYVLARDFLTNADVITDVSKVQYTYSNPRLVSNDFSTWKYLDTIIYVLTGQIPTKENPYLSYLYSDGTNVYLKVGEKYVKINDSSTNTVCLLSGSNVLTNQIYSDNRKTFDNVTKFNEYYKGRLKGMLVDGSTLSAGESLSNFYYYSKDYQGASVSKLNKLMSDFDFILIENGVAVVSNGLYTFAAKRVDGEVYVNIKGTTWMKLSTNDSALIYYKENSLLSNASSAFDSEGEHIAFEKTSGVFNYTQFDSILYSVFGKAVENQSFKKYKCKINDQTYLDVEGKLVKFEDGAGYYDTLDISSTTVSDEKATFLYDNFYSQFVGTSVPSAKAQYNLNSAHDSGIDLTVSTVVAGHGFAIISKRLGITDIKNCILIESSDGLYYLKHGSYYINISTLIKVSLSKSSSGTSITLSLADNSKETFRWKFRLIQGSASLSFRTAEKINDVDVTDTDWSEYIKEYSNVIDTDSERDAIKITNDLGTWTWLGLVSAYVDPTNLYEVHRYYHMGKVYYHFRSSSSDYLVSYNQTGNNGAFTLDSAIASTSGAFSFIRSSYTVPASSKLESVIEALGVSTSDVVKYESKIDEIKDFYYVKKLVGLTTTYYVIYGLEDAGGTMSSVLTYVKYNTSTSTFVDTETSESEGTIFSFTSRPLTDIKSWTMLDFVASYVTESIYATTINSKIYVFDSKYYLKYDEKFMLLPKLSSANLSDLFDYSSPVGYVKNSSTITSNEIQLDEIITSGSYKEVSSVTTVQCVYNYADMTTELKGKIVAFANSVKVSTSANPFQQISFSENFDLSNYKSWTYSDYVLYYAFTNGFYGNTAMTVKYNLPFVYIPKFVKNSETYYNLTFLDIVLAKMCGETSGQFNYLIDTQAKYAFNLIYTDSNVFYLKYDGHYVPLSSEIGINFAKMEVTSTELGENIAEADIRTKVEEFTNTPTDYYLGDDLGAGVTQYNYETEFNNKNFQTFVNPNCAPAYIYYLLDQDKATGNVKATKVINFAFETDTKKEGTYFAYDKFYEFYDDYLVNHLNTTKAYELNVDISTGDLTGPNYDIVAKLVYDQIYPDLVFDDYYYYTVDADKLSALSINTIDPAMQKIIREGNFSGSAIKQKQINLKLSSEFWTGTNVKMASKDSWSVLDYIILYERSRENVRHNAFKNISIDELATTDYLYTVYCVDIDEDDDIDAEDDIYLYINNNFYNLRKYVSVDAEGRFIGGKLFTAVSGASNPILNGNINGYDFKVLFDSYPLSINPIYQGYEQYNRTSDNVSFKNGTSPEILSFKYLDTNYVNTNFRINVSLYAQYSVNGLIKKTSWVEKLMTDMQVYYPDLNWGVLLATDGWLDTLGEFTSANINGLFTGGQNSANTTAPGLVLSEFFMSVAKETDSGYANYEYSSVFDEDTIRALMMSLMGEENYQALVFEAEVFMDYFNSCFAPIIDDFADEFGEDINDNSLRLNAYKSYLATLLLSSDIGEYLYTIATRVYAEYTIGEYLASAAGDYVGYYSYVNYLKDEDGNPVEAYSYGSILELIRYENQYCGGTNPVFTFNFKKAFNKYKTGGDDGTVAGFNLSQALSNEAIYDIVSERLLSYIDADYEDIYELGYDVNEYGKVVDSEGNEVKSKSSETHIYCYMLHVYWEIKNEVTFFTEPSYLKLYRSYLDGKLYRWDIVKNENIQNADQYFEKYQSELLKLNLYKFTSVVNTARLFIPVITFNEQTDNSILDILKQVINLIGDAAKSLIFFDASNVADNISVPMINANSILKHDAEFKKDISFITQNTLTLFFTMGFSEDSALEINDIFKEFLDSLLPADLSPEACWNKILQYQKSLENIIGELKEVRNLLPGETTERGSSRKIGNTSAYYTDMQMDVIINAYVDVKNNIDNYISTQQRIDQAQKKSITFTLAQYGANYVTSGYQFSVRNRPYTFKPETDPLRLAEYVYGGAFLEKVGEGAKYTDPDFTGIVKASKVYDNKDKVLKTHLDTWSELRGFLSKIAGKTAELYFTTNLADLDVSKNNAIKLRDPISVSFKGTSYNSIEEALYHYMISGIHEDIVVRITNSIDPATGNKTNEYQTYSHERFVSMAQYIFSYNISEEDLEDITLEEFKRFAMKQVVANEQNQFESPEERASKYMMVFNILGVQVDLKQGSSAVDRVLYNSQVDKTLDANGKVTQVKYKNGNLINGTLRVSDATLESIKVLSGLQNRPNREVLTRQYAGIRVGDYYDEAFGDTFIACTYKDGLYYPILGSASKVLESTNANYKDYMEQGFIKHRFTSNYYDNDSNVVVMKGVITADGYPTAIRKYNNPIEVLQKGLFSSKAKTFNAVTYYRTNVGSNFGSGEDLIDASRAVGRVSTKNYTKYVYGTAFTNGIGSTTTFTGRTNLRTTVSSDYNASFVQARSEYLMGQADDYGAISVLDDFSYFYVFGGQSWVLLMLAFITIFPVMFNAVGGAASRILDILVLFISSPLIISTNSLLPDGKNSIYKKWKKNMQVVLMSAFGYIIAFTAFTLLVPMVYSINSFISIETYDTIVGIGGLGGFISYPMINGLLRFLWIVTAVSILEKLPQVLLPIITANRGDIASPHPGLGSGAGKKFTDKAKSVVKSAKEVGSILSGKAAMGALTALKDDALSMIPGYDAFKLAKEKVVDPLMDKAREHTRKIEETAIEEGLKYYGVDAQTARAAAKAVTAAQDAKNKAKEENKQKAEKYKQEFQNMQQ